MKKILCFLLVFQLAFSLTLTSFAEINIVEPNVDIDYGRYYLVSSYNESHIVTFAEQVGNQSAVSLFFGGLFSEFSFLTGAILGSVQNLMYVPREGDLLQTKSFVTYDARDEKFIVTNSTAGYSNGILIPGSNTYSVTDVSGGSAFTEMFKRFGNQIPRNKWPNRY